MSGKENSESKTLMIGPSILSADFARLADEVARVEEAGADYLHVDVMDGHFVPNITIGPPVVEAVKKVAKIPLDVHLMIDRPERYVKDFVNAGSDYLTIHAEATPHVHGTIQEIKKLGAKAGLSLNPATPITEIMHVLDDIDLLLIMTVNPGFGGQKFIIPMLPKISQAAGILETRHSHIMLMVDGGVSPETAKAVVSAGARWLVAGSAVFSKDDYAKAISDIRTEGMKAI